MFTKDIMIESINRLCNMLIITPNKSLASKKFTGITPFVWFLDQSDDAIAIGPSIWIFSYKENQH